MVRRALATSRQEAQEAIRAGLVAVGGSPVDRPARLVDPAEAIQVAGSPRRFVSRGGEKLAAALDAFQIDPRGRHCLDAGASTGGFTDALLQRGAVAVTAVDVGYGQLAWSLREDPRVVVMERTNVRDLAPDDVAVRPDLVVADLSFIPLSLVVAVLVRLAADGADLVLLVKPQFEAGRAAVGPGGVVRDPAAWRRSIEAVVDAGEKAGAGALGLTVSPLPGPAGNVEFLLHLRVGALTRELGIGSAIEAGMRLAGAA